MQRVSRYQDHSPAPRPTARPLAASRRSSALRWNLVELDRWMNTENMGDTHVSSMFWKKSHGSVPFPSHHKTPEVPPFWDHWALSGDGITCQVPEDLRLPQWLQQNRLVWGIRGSEAFVGSDYGCFATIMHALSRSIQDYHPLIWLQTAYICHR